MLKIFKFNSAKFIELQIKDFDTERILQNIIEKDLSIFFDGLEFLTSEFQINDLRPDTVAFDNEKNTFVIIEYKKVKNKQVMDQGATYYRLLKEHKENFVLLYNRLKNKQYDVTKFNWDEIYVIFLSPEFTKYQIGASGIGLPVQLFKIRQYQDGLLSLERIEDKMNEGDKLSLSPKSKSTKSYVRLDEYDEEDYLSGKYKTGNASDKTRELYSKIKRRILDTFEDLELRQKKAYVGFYSIENDSCICTLDVAKSKIKLTYSITSAKKLLQPSNFIRDVTNIGIFGVGHYQSEIKTESDLEKAMPFIQKVYDYKMNS